jgi:hypothetical protein
MIPPTVPQTQLAPTPTCTSQADCDMKWSAARTFVLSHSGYKFQTYTPDFMETYSPANGDVALGAQVNREPAENGSYRISAKFWCDNIFACVPAAAPTLNAFNIAVGSVGESK